MPKLKLKTASGKSLNLDVKEQPSFSKLKEGMTVILTLNKKSQYFHPFLQKIEAKIWSVSGDQITIPAPVKNATTALWTIHKDEIDLLLLKV
jgi:hypothetical protein